MDAFSEEKSINAAFGLLEEISEYVENNADTSDAYTMECEIQERIRGIGLKMLELFFASKGVGDVGEELLENGATFKKQPVLRGRDYYSVFGKIKIPRAYYYNGESGGIFPLDDAANLPKRCYSYLLQEYTSLLGLKDPFAETSSALRRILGLDLKKSRIEVVVGETGSDYGKFYEEKKTPAAETEGSIAVVGADGKGVPVIKKEAAKIVGRQGKGEKRQKKKEAIVGVSYTVDPKRRTAESVADNLVYPDKAKDKAKDKGRASPKALNVRRIASLERSKESVMREVADDYKARNPSGERPLVAVMDGALHLWTLLSSVLAGIKYVGVLDIIHVVEYLWDAGNCLYGERTENGKAWVHKQLIKILEGKVGRVVGGLRQIMTKRTELSKAKRKVLNKVVGYFENHRQWMKYDEYLAAGYPIGSGVVESSCGHTVKGRMEGAGRRWSIKGAESVLLLRSVYTSGDWDEYWKAHMSIRHCCLYGEAENDDYHKNNVRYGGNIAA